MKEYEDLKANRQFRKEFPRVLMDKFTEAFYPRPIRIENTPSFQSYHTSEEMVEGAAMQNSSFLGYETGMDRGLSVCMYCTVEWCVPTDANSVH